jgi:hypothetical protein
VTHGGGSHVRFCCLFEDTMCWFKAPTDKYPTKFIRLKDMRYSPRPKLNENGVADARKFILIDVNGEKVLFEAATAAERDKWVNAITFQFELAKGIAPTTVSPLAAHAAVAPAPAPTHTTTTTAASTLPRRSTAGSAAPTPVSPARVVTVVDSDDDDDDGGDGGGDAASLFPSVPSTKPSLPDESSTIDLSLFPDAPVSAGDTLDLSLFPAAPTAAAAAPAPSTPTLKSELFPTPAVGTVPRRTSQPAVVAAATSQPRAATLTAAMFPSVDRAPETASAAAPREAMFECLFPGCRMSYTEEANLVLHLRKKHPSFARDHGYGEDAPQTPVLPPTKAPITISVAPEPVRSPPPLVAPDPKESLYSAFLLGADVGGGVADTAGRRSPSPTPSPRPTPSRFGGKTSADAIAAVAAEKARRAAAAAAVAAAVAPSAPSAPATEPASHSVASHHAAPVASAPPATMQLARAVTTSGVIGGDDGDDDIPDAPDIPDTPSFDTSSLDELPRAAFALPAAPQTLLKPPAARPHEEDEADRSPRSAFSASALLNARKQMKAPPATKGVSLEPTPVRAAASTSPRPPARADGEKSPAMLQSLLQLLFKTEEALTDATRAAAVANWMALFDGKWATLQRLVDDYAGLVRAHALQPNTAYKKMSAWEKGLFKRVSDSEAAELRKQKMFFMETLELPDIEEHIAKHWVLVEAKKKQAAEAERKAAQGAGMMGVLGQLKSRGEEQRARELAEAAAKLPPMEQSIEFEDD